MQMKTCGHVVVLDFQLYSMLSVTHIINIIYDFKYPASQLVEVSVHFHILWEHQSQDILVKGF